MASAIGRGTAWANRRRRSITSGDLPTQPALRCIGLSEAIYLLSVLPKRSKSVFEQRKYSRKRVSTRTHKHGRMLRGVVRVRIKAVLIERRIRRANI